MSASMRQKSRRNRFRFWPKTVARLLPAHSSRGSSRLTAEGHLGLDAGHPEMGEHRRQVGIGLAVIDQETGIDRMD
jgi:hypothetical protein